MEITINSESTVPAYMQLFDHIAAAMEAEEYKKGERLPSETELCGKTGLSKGTVRQTFDRLETEGYIKRIHGSGTYVLDWHPEHRAMYLFRELCRKEGLDGEQTFALLKAACGRHFKGEAPREAAVIDCTPEIADDIAREIERNWNIKVNCYDVVQVRQGFLTPKEELWITTRVHYEEVLPEAVRMKKELVGTVIMPDRTVSSQILALDEDCLLGIVYDSQDFLMYISHNLTLLGRHNTYVLCQREEWKEKNRAIRQKDIVWLVPAMEADIILQMKELGSNFIVYSYEVEKESLEEMRTYMERKK